MPTETDTLRTVMMAAGAAQYQAAMLGSASATGKLDVASKLSGATTLMLARSQETAAVATLQKTMADRVAAVSAARLIVLRNELFSATLAAAVAEGTASQSATGLAAAEAAAALGAHELALAEAEAAAAGTALQASLAPVLLVLVAMAVSTAAMVAGLLAAAKAAKDLSAENIKFEKLLVDMATQSSFTSAEMQRLRDHILSVDSALSHAELVGAITPFAFAAWEAEDAFVAMVATAKAAEAYQVAAAEAGSALLKTLVAFNIEAKYSAYVMDVIAAAAAGGTMEFKELAQYIPRVASQAGAAGLKLEEMGAALQAISFYSGNAREATGLLVSLFRSLAMEGYDAEIAERGLVNVLRDLYDETGGNRAALMELLGTAEAVDAVVKFATNDFHELEKAMLAQAEAAGTVADATAKREDSLENALGKAAKAIEDVKVKGGALVNQMGGPWIRGFAMAARAVADFAGEISIEMTGAAEDTEDSQERIRAAAIQLVDAFGEIVNMTLEVSKGLALLAANNALAAANVQLLVVAYRELALYWAQQTGTTREIEAAKAALQMAKDARALSLKGMVWSWKWAWSGADEAKAKIAAAIAAIKAKLAEMETAEPGDSEKPPPLDPKGAAGASAAQKAAWANELIALKQRRDARLMEYEILKAQATDAKALAQLEADHAKRMLDFGREIANRELWLGNKEMQGLQKKVNDLHAAAIRAELELRKVTGAETVSGLQDELKLLQQKKELLKTTTQDKQKQAQMELDFLLKVKDLEMEIIAAKLRAGDITQKQAEADALKIVTDLERAKNSLAAAVVDRQGKALRDYKEAAKETRAMYEAVQAVIGGQLHGQVREAIERLSGAGLGDKGGAAYIRRPEQVGRDKIVIEVRGLGVNGDQARDVVMRALMPALSTASQQGVPAA